MSKKISEILPRTEILAQLAEEASELAQAALKQRSSWMNKYGECPVCGKKMED